MESKRIFYCHYCNSTYGGDGERMTCPECGSILIPTQFGVQEWRNFSDSNKRDLRAKMHNAYAEIAQLNEKLTEAEKHFKKASFFSTISGLALKQAGRSAGSSYLNNLGNSRAANGFIGDNSVQYEIMQNLNRALSIDILDDGDENKKSNQTRYVRK